MVLINLKKSQVFLRDLNQVKNSLTQLNSIDLTIKKIVKAMESFLNAPENVDAQEIQTILSLAKEIVQSYENHKLVEALDRLLDELDFMTTSQKVANLERKVHLFYLQGK